MKRIYLSLLIIATIFAFPIAAIASDITNAQYYGNITITNSDTTANTNISVALTTANLSNSLIDGGYTDSDFEQVAVRNSAGSDVVFMPGNDESAWIFWVPSIGAGSNINYILYTGNASLSSTKYYFPGTTGMTRLYTANITPKGGSTWDYRIEGYFNMASGGNFYRDPNASNNANCRIYASSASTVKLEFTGGGSLTAGNMTSGYHTLRVYEDMVSDEAQIWVDGVSCALGGCADTSGFTPQDVNFINDSLGVYMKSLQIYKDGVKTLDIEWNYGATFTDLSGNSNDLTPSFRTTSSDSNVSAVLSSFEPIEEADPPGWTVEDPEDFITANITTSGNFTSSSVPAGGPPGFAVVDDAASAGGINNAWLWGILGALAIAMAGLFITWMERAYGSGGGTLILRIITTVSIFGLLIAFQKFDFWMLFMFIVMAGAFAMMSRQIEWGGNVSQLNIIGFLAQSWIGLTIINRILEGQLLTSAENAWANYYAFTQEFKLFNLFSMPVINLQFFTDGIPALMRWDYAVFGGNAQIIQYMLYSLTAVVSLIIFTIIIGLLYSAFNRLR